MRITRLHFDRSARAPRRLRAGAAALALLAAVVGCRGLLDEPLPAGTKDPASFRNPDGALARYQYVLEFARQTFIELAVEQGTITDELQDGNLGGLIPAPHPLDQRLLPEASTTQQYLGASSYALLHMLRGQAADAIGMLRKYAPAAPTALTGEMYALQGFAEIGLADEYCSGVPLSTLDFEGDFTYRPGSPTEAVYAHAIALFDTAITLAADSARIIELARVGRGRALLALGRFDDASAAVADVAGDFQYQFVTDWGGYVRPSDGYREPAPLLLVTVADGEGGNGLPFISSGDARTATSTTRSNQFGRPIFEPARYQGIAPFTLADWVEARLIIAEARLNAGDAEGWLTALNELRRTAITPALADTTDPGTEQSRIDLLFRERAFWLFLTGHRQGDLRRLLRQYGRRQEDVFPTGAYPGGQGGLYGVDVTMPIPADERANPFFTGCINRAP